MAIEIREAREGFGTKCSCGMPANRIIDQNGRYISLCRSCFAQLRDKLNQFD